jgi:hypothetical protein
MYDLEEFTIEKMMYKFFEILFDKFINKNLEE